MSKGEHSDAALPDGPRQGSGHSPAWRGVLRGLQILLPILVLLGAGLGMRWMLQHRVRAKRRKPKQRAVMVEVTPVKLGSHRVVVKAMGKIRPAREVSLHPRVKGEVLSISGDLLPGGLVDRGHVLVRIDSADYRVAVRQGASAVKQLEADLRLELGRQAIARKAFGLLGDIAKKSSRDLVLRGPQLRKAKASLEAARAALRRAELDLKRTVVRAPINAVVLSRDIDVGTRVTETTRLARIVGTDAFWVELVVPVSQLRWIRIPALAGAPGARVRIRDPAAWGKGRTRTGRVIRLAPELEEKGRMARIIARVDDPLAVTDSHRGQPRLLIGSWVEAQIEGSDLESVAVLPRSLIRDGDRVWRVDDRGRLDIRRVTLTYRGRNHVVVSKGVSSGDRIVASDIATPVQGMLLRVLKKRAPFGKGKAP